MFGSRQTRYSTASEITKEGELGSVTKWNPQHLIVYGAWLKNKEVPATEARDLCLKECPEDDPGLKNVEGWLARFADQAEPWIPAGGHLLAQLDEVTLARNMFYCQFCSSFITKEQRREHLLQHRDKVLDWFGWPRDLSNDEMLKRLGV